MRIRRELFILILQQDLIYMRTYRILDHSAAELKGRKELFIRSCDAPDTELALYTCHRGALSTFHADVERDHSPHLLRHPHVPVRRKVAEAF